MSLEPKKYRSNKTQAIADAATRQAFEDLAQKLEQLARDANTKIDTFPSGAIVFWLGTAATIPAGWSIATELQGRFPRGMGVGGTVGTTGGSDTHSHDVTHTHTGAANADSGSAHHHTISPDGSHYHYLQGGFATGYQGGGTYGAAASSTYTDTAPSHSHGTATGNPAGTNEGQHSHNLTINNYTGSTGTQSTLPSYVDGIWIRKD